MNRFFIVSIFVLLLCTYSVKSQTLVTTGETPVTTATPTTTASVTTPATTTTATTASISTTGSLPTTTSPTVTTATASTTGSLVTSETTTTGSTTSATVSTTTIEAGTTSNLGKSFFPQFKFAQLRNLFSRPEFFQVITFNGSPCKYFALYELCTTLRNLE